LSIRLATTADLTTLLSTIRDLYPGEIWDDAQYWKAVSKFPTWITEDSGKVTASLVSEVSKGTPYIWSVATDPAYRGKGLATALIKEFEKYYIAQDYGRAWLHTRVDNPAQKLYFDLGYRVASLEPNLYAPHIHGLIMRKRLV
jgi:ribosomal protein S18 acetylase RimI-like enzyme